MRLAHCMLPSLTDFYMEFHVMVNVTTCSSEPCPLLSCRLTCSARWLVQATPDQDSPVTAQREGVLTVWRSPERGDSLPNEQERKGKRKGRVSNRLSQVTAEVKIKAALHLSGGEAFKMWGGGTSGGHVRWMDPGVNLSPATCCRLCWAGFLPPGVSVTLLAK